MGKHLLFARCLERLDIFEAIKLISTPGLRRLRLPAVSLGMLYYQLRDRL